MNYEKITPETLSLISAIVGEKNVLTDAELLQPYSHDEVTDPAYHHMPEVVVFAENTDQVAKLVKLANEKHFSVVPRGAGTGLACGAVPIYAVWFSVWKKWTKSLKSTLKLGMQLLSQASEQMICRKL